MQTVRFFQVLFATALVLCLAASAVRAAEPETHILNEALSLTGDCSTGKLDLIPDPGCPGGVHPPAGPFANPSSIATDLHGDIYVGSAGPIGNGGGINPDGARIDIFDSSGHYLNEVAVPGTRVLAIDATGHLYVYAQCNSNLPPPNCYSEEHEKRFLRFDPTKYSPSTGEIAYEDPPIELPLELAGSVSLPVDDLEVDPRNQHVFVRYGLEIQELGPAVPNEPNVTLETGIAASAMSNDQNETSGIGIDVAHNRLYAVGCPRLSFGCETVVRVFELDAPHNLLNTLDGSNTPAGEFLSPFGLMDVAVEESTGDFFVGDIESGRVVYEFEEDGSYVTSFKHGFEAERGHIQIDNSPESPNQGYLFVPAGHAVPGHLFAFQPKPPAQPPVIEAVSTSGIGGTEAVIHATINPEANATHYVFEVTTQALFEAQGFAGASIAGSGDLSPGVSGVAVSSPLEGLTPGTAYRYRVRAESACEPGGCRAEMEGSLTTFGEPLQGGTCANVALRTGPSALLPDCRAYELVTPSDMNGHPPKGPVSGVGGRFGTLPMNAAGDILAFRAEGGPIPGTEATGGFNGDSYLATRTPTGWQTTLDGPTGEQSPVASPGSLSRDLGYISWAFNGRAGTEGLHIRYPDGSFRLVGEGALTTDLSPDLHYIGPNGSHTIFSSSKQLVVGAPGGSTKTIYDRTADGALHVASLLPGGIVPNEGEGADYAGHSVDGSTIAFAIPSSGPLYLRVNDAVTLTAAPAGAAFAGLSEDGRYLFYVSGTGLYRFDAQLRETVKIAGGSPQPVNIPAAGAGAYFVSKSKLVNTTNPNGAKATAGQENLYYWNGQQLRFVATVTTEDVKGEEGNIGGPGFFGGLEEWMKNVSIETFGWDPARSSHQGSTLLFLSQAQLTAYDSEGFREVYRYDAGEDKLVCVSCSPTGSAPVSNAKLTTFGNETILNHYTLAANLSDDGERAFFETSDRLVRSDVDSLQDVYEWEAQGKGSCRDAAGCIFLVSSGQSARPNYFFGASASGDDVAFSTSDLLTQADEDETPSVYDARVEGGFATAVQAAGECLGETCQPAVTPPPVVSPASSVFHGSGNPKEKAHCPKGKHAVRRHGSRRCAKKHVKRRRRHHKRHHHRKHRHRAKTQKKPNSHRQGRSVR